MSDSRSDHLTAARVYQDKLAAANYAFSDGMGSIFSSEEKAKIEARKTGQTYFLIVWGSGSPVVRAILESHECGSHVFRGKWSIYRFLKTMNGGSNKPEEVSLFAFENEVDAIFTKMFS